MMKPRFELQAALIAGIAQRTRLSPEALAARVAIKPETMRKVSKGYQKASDQLLAALKNLEMSVLEEGMTKRKVVIGEPDIVSPEGFRRVPVLSWARAGSARDYGELCRQIGEWTPTECQDPNAFALIIEGDSMYPEFIAGDSVVFAPNSEPRNGDVVVCRLNEVQGVLFRRFRRCGDEGMTIRLESLNSAYKVLEYSLSEFRFIYPAVDMCRKLRR
jgi:SOS-response transcriptional repressor LexA